MADRYLKVSYRNGKAFAAYLFLARRPDDRSARTERFSEGLSSITPRTAARSALSVHPQAVTADELNQALAHIHQPPLRSEDFAPLKAA